MEIVVETYNEKWPMLFQEEKDLLEVVFGNELLEIHHIGSTSVPGLSAKPTIDMMPIVHDIDVIDSFDNDMIALGYTPVREHGIEGRRFYKKGVSKRTHHIHIYQYDNKEQIDQHLAFRDYLRTHPEAANEYARLKIDLAKQFYNNRVLYTESKGDFVSQTVEKALEWYQDKIDKRC